MKSHPTPEQLFDTTKKIPTEMDILQIDRIVRDFPATNGESPNGTYPKLLTVAALLATAALLLLLLQRAGNEPPRLAAAFPTAEVEAPGTPQVEKPAEIIPEDPAKEVAAPVRTNLEGTAEAAPTTPSTSPAPAHSAGSVTTAAPTTPSAPQTPALAANQTSAAKKPSPVGNDAYLPAFGETTISGSYEMRDGKILLETTERVNGRKITWMLPVTPSAEEQRLLFPHDGGTGYLDRETGRLILMKEDGRHPTKGTFSFQPRIEARKAYEKAGLGTNDAPAELIKLSGMQQGVSLAPEVFTRQPAEILWLRYFTLGIDREYLNLLREMGYDGEDFSRFSHDHGSTGLWQLANNGLTAGELKSLDRDLKVLYGRVGEAFSFAKLTELYQKRLLLTALVKEGYRYLGSEQLWSLLASDIRPAYLRDMNEVFGRKLAPDELLALREAKLFDTGIRRMQRDGYRDLSVAEYIRLHTEPKTTEEALEDVQMLTVTEDFGRKKKNWRSSKLDLKTFDKLVVEGDIRLVIIPGETNQAEIVKVDMKGVDVELEVSGDGTLRIRKKTKLGWNVKGFVIAEIRLTASALERIEVKDPARVFLVGDPSAYAVKGRLANATLE